VLYVGETESARQRLKQHRDKYKAQGYSFNAAVVTMPNKSAARRLETSLIQALKARGFDIENDSDGRHVLFGNK
jgi:predicted GIY-YIG superfamily endonuclease